MEHINESEYKDTEGNIYLFYTIAYHTTKGDKYREVVVSAKNGDIRTPMTF
jgi:integrase/recombinase XerD